MVSLVMSEKVPFSCTGEPLSCIFRVILFLTKQRLKKGTLKRAGVCSGSSVVKTLNY